MLNKINRISEDWTLFESEHGLKLALHLNCSKNSTTAVNWTIFEEGRCKKCHIEFPKTLKIVYSI